MTHLQYFERLRREHPTLAGWLLLPSDRIDHAFRPTDGIVAAAALVSRRFYREQTGYAMVSGPEIGLVLSRSPLTQTIKDPALLGLLERTAQDYGSLVFVAPAFGDELIATLAINQERKVISAMALVAAPDEIERLAGVFDVSLSGDALSPSTVHLDEVLATPNGTALLCPRGGPIGLVSVGGVNEAEMWRAWREMSAAV